MARPSRVPSRSASRSSVAASRASTGSTASDFIESWAARSRRPIINAISRMMDGYRSARATIGSCGILRTVVGSVACADAG